MKKIGLTLMSLMLLSTLALGMPPGRMRSWVKWWQNQRIQKHLGLEPAQIQQLDDIHYRYQKQLIDLRAQVQKLQTELDRAMNQETWNEKEIIDLAKKAMDARNQVELKQLQMTLEMRKVLRPEQWQKLVELRKRLRSHFFRQRRMKRRPPKPQKPPQSPPG